MFYRIETGEWDQAGTMSEVMDKASAGQVVSLCGIAVSESVFEGREVRCLGPVVQAFRVVLFGGEKALLPLEGPTMPEHGGWPDMSDELPAPILEMDGALLNV